MRTIALAATIALGIPIFGQIPTYDWRVPSSSEVPPMLFSEPCSPPHLFWEIGKPFRFQVIDHSTEPISTDEIRRLDSWDASLDLQPSVTPEWSFDPQQHVIPEKKPPKPRPGRKPCTDPRGHVIPECVPEPRPKVNPCLNPEGHVIPECTPYPQPKPSCVDPQSHVLPECKKGLFEAFETKERENLPFARRFGQLSDSVAPSGFEGESAETVGYFVVRNARNGYWIPQAAANDRVEVIPLIQRPSAALDDPEAFLLFRDPCRGSPVRFPSSDH